MSGSNDRSISRRDVLRTAATTGVASVGLSGGVAADSPDSEDVTAHGMQDSIPQTGDRTVQIKTRGEATYELSVTGTLTATGAPASTVDRGTATATISGDSHEFTFSGEFTQFNLDGDARVTVDGTPFDVSAFPRHRLEIDPSGKLSFDVSASGGVRVEGASVERPTPRRAVGDARETVTIAYEGELTYLDIDGEATLQKNGQRVTDTAAALPSPRPHVARVQTSRGSYEYELGVSGDTAMVSSTAPSTADGDTVTGRAVNGASTLRYAGRAIRFERGDGAAMEFDEKAKRVRCHAPEDEPVTFSLQSSDGFVRDGKLAESPTVTVPAGETELVKYVGDVTGGSIGSLELDLTLSAYPEASDSARLQHAAEMERHDVFGTLAESARKHGRIRYDVDAFAGLQVDPSDSKAGYALGTFALTDVTRGDKAEVHLVVGDDGSVREARNEYRWLSGGNIETLELDRLDTGAGVSTANANTFTTESYDYDLPEQRGSVPGQTQDEVTTQGILGDIWDGLTGFVGDIAGMTKDLLKDAINTAINSVTSISAEDIVVKSAEIVCSSFSAIEALYEEFMKRASKSSLDKWAKAIIKTKAKFFIGSSILIGSDFVEEAQEGNYGCAGCIFSISFLFEVICGKVSQKIGCAAISWPSAGLGGVGCVIVLEAVCGFATILLPDAKSICSGSTTPAELDLC